MHGRVNAVKTLVVDVFAFIVQPVKAGPKADSRMLGRQFQKKTFNLAVIFCLSFITITATTQIRYRARPADIAAFFANKPISAIVRIKE